MKRWLAVGPLVILSVWSLVTYGGFVDRIFLPPLFEVLGKLAHLLVTGSIWRDTGATVWRWLLGTALGSTAGVALGLIMGSSDRVGHAIEIPIDFFRSLPVVSLFPLFLLIFGIGDTAKVAVAAWASLLYVTVNTIYGVRYSRSLRVPLARSLRASRMQMMAKITFPGALPAIFSGLRVALSLSLAVVVATEMIMGTNHGLGRRIFEDALVYRTADLYATIIVAGCLGYGANLATLRVERFWLHWIRS